MVYRYIFSLVFLFVISCSEIDRDNILDPKNPSSKRDKVLLLEAFVNTENPAPYNIGIIGVAMQEYTEARLFYDLIENKKFTPVEDLEVTDSSYLLGIADLIGELRRFILENLVEGDIDTAKYFYGIMKELYGTYLQIEFGKNLIPELRRKKDTARVLVERTLSDLFVAQQSRNLEKRLDEKSKD